MDRSKIYHPKVVVIAGIYRSGSTFMFNVARLLLRRRGVVWGGGYPEMKPLMGEPIESTLDAKFIIIKEHRWFSSLEAAADVVFTSDRKSREIQRSFERMGREAPALEKIAKWRTWLAKWMSSPKNAFHMPYSMLEWSRFECALEIAKGLFDKGVVLDDFHHEEVHEVCLEAQALPVPEDSRKDPVTLLFRHHKTKALPSDESEQIPE